MEASQTQEHDYIHADHVGAGCHLEFIQDGDSLGTQHAQRCHPVTS
jgi:hypothetical protein